MGYEWVEQEGGEKVEKERSYLVPFQVSKVLAIFILKMNSEEGLWVIKIKFRSQTRLNWFFNCSQMTLNESSSQYWMITRLGINWNTLCFQGDSVSIYSFILSFKKCLLGAHCISGTSRFLNISINKVQVGDKWNIWSGSDVWWKK